MSLQDATELIRHSLIMVLIVSSPMLIIGLVVYFTYSVKHSKVQALNAAPKN